MEGSIMNMLRKFTLHGVLVMLSCLGSGFFFIEVAATPDSKSVGAAAATICPIVQVEALMRECVFMVDNGKTFAYYIEKVTAVVRANKPLFQQRYHHIDIDKLLSDLNGIKNSRSVMKIAWKLWDYWELLPDEFWNKGTWERKRLIGQRLKWD